MVANEVFVTVSTCAVARRHNYCVVVYSRHSRDLCHGDEIQLVYRCVMAISQRKYIFCYGEALVIDPSSLLWLGIVGLTTTLSSRVIEKTSQLMCCDFFRRIYRNI